MFLLPPLLGAFAGAAIVAGFRLAVMPFLDPKVGLWRSVLLACTTLLGWRYVFWRFSETVAPLELTADAVVSWGFATLEALTVVSSTIAFVILARIRERSDEATRFANWWLPEPAPRVDVFIATYNEELEVLERTIVGAKMMHYPQCRVFVLDDGHRDWLRDACDRLQVGYISRGDNSHAKAGNINHAFAQRARDADAPQFVAVLDADFIPHQDFVSRAIALFHDPSVGLVQTPQHFFNPDPVQHNLGISSAYPDEQRHFFDNVEPSRDAWGIAVCCGTSSMVRVSAVEAINGFPTESVTEDFLLSLRLAENGWQTVYLNEPLTEGLAPEGLREYIVQRGRWCLGMMQIVRNAYSPWGHHRLSPIHRLSILDSLLYWTTTFTFRIASLICPLLYWWLGLIVVNATLTDVIIYYVPYYMAVMATLNWLSRGLFIPILNDVAQLMAAWPITRAAFIGLLTKGPHRFSVTAKGGDRTKVIVQWPLMLPFLVLFGLTLGGLVVTLTSDFVFNHAAAAGDGLGIVLFWTVYNLLVLLIAIAACIERPRANRPQRQTIEPITLTGNDGYYRGWLVNLGVGGARVRGPSGLSPGAQVTLRLSGVGEVSGEVRATTDDGYRLQLFPDEPARQAIIAKLYTASAAPGTGRGDIALMIRELARSLTR